MLFWCCRAETRTATGSMCGRHQVAARRLLMGNRHGNRCHVTRSRSPGSLPRCFVFFFILLQKTGREQTDERGREDEFRGGGEKKRKEAAARTGIISEGGRDLSHSSRLAVSNPVWGFERHTVSFEHIFAPKWDVFNEITPLKTKRGCSCFLKGVHAVLMKGPAGMKQNG